MPSRPRIPRKLLILLVAPIAAAIVSALAALSVAAGTDKPERPKLHRDADVLEQATLDATLAFVREDGKRARAALDLMVTATRQVKAEEADLYGEEVSAYEGAYRKTLNLARELTSAGELEEAFNQLVWAQRTCVKCHGLAREAGLLGPPPVREAGE